MFSGRGLLAQESGFVLTKCLVNFLKVVVTCAMEGEEFVL